MSDTVARYVGLDVHAKSVALAVAESGRTEPQFIGEVSNDWDTLKRKLKRLGGPKRICCCYEAGPTGYGLYRALTAAGYPTTVVAPSLVPVKPASR